MTLTVLAAVGVVCGLVLMRLASRWLAEKLGLLPWLGILIGGLALFLLGLDLYGRWSRWALFRWADRDGWSTLAVHRDWPWATTEPGVTAPVVLCALSKTVDGLPVTVGEVTWAPGRMLDVAGAAKGHGFFAVLRLPRRYTRLGVHRKLNPHRLQPGQDEFARSFWTICTDAELAVSHIGPDIKAAHVAGNLPDWMLVNDELYVVARGAGPLKPSVATDLTRQVCRIADLLRLTRD
ncbi:hypothetical protein [Rugosimonospora africana]|uniref:Uncharacterized protein n=1 Tax=Rugosimonospora africana TaxID=556532 RepID=A0A8J3VVD7_9ACTN|nr:hypothetical protein [Rugosimonospora africana]GIH19676.1 hypothetical protein Raf01_78480 [Rugosimonospora africana]